MYPFIETILREKLRDPSVSFVFPSEVAAASWSRRALDVSSSRAVSVDRFLGWDTFKARLFSGRPGGLPPERLLRVRLLWASAVLAENAASPFLRTLVRPEHGRDYQGYVPFLANTLPSLKRIADRAALAPSDAKVRDLVILYSKYSAFLSERGLFEPAFEPLPAPETDEAYILFCPELAQDYEDYRPSLEALPAVRVVPLPDTEKTPELLEFPNIFEEFRWIFQAVARDLEAGLRPEEIAVTATDVEAQAPWIRKAARLAGVPGEIRSGPPLAKHPVGRFLTSLGTCAERGFDLQSMNALLLDRFLPWKEPELVRALVRFGMRRHAYAPFHADGRRRDAWLESFRVCGTPLPGLDSFYRKLRSGAEELTGAKDFKALASSFVKFRRSFLDESLLSEEDERSFQRAMVELEGFAREEAVLGLPNAGTRPFSLFQEALALKKYVPQSLGPSVPIYAYRVSALLAVKRHYVAGSSQAGLHVSFGDAPGLREDQKEALGCPDRDASPSYAGAYAASGSSVFSYSVEGLGGWNLPFPWFSRHGQVRKPGDYEEVRASDPWAGETRAWTGRPFPEKILSSQAEAARSAATALRRPFSSYETDLAAPEAVRAVLARVTDEAGRLRLSSTHVEEMISCPFAWLLARGLALEEEISGIGFFDARLAGQMAHDALRILYTRISETGPFDASRLPEYRVWAEVAVSETLPKFERDQGPFLGPMFEAYVPKLVDRIRRLLADEAESYRGWTVESLESAKNKEYPELNAVLVGRLDRLARLGDEFAIIDYKKRSLPNKKDVYPDEDGALGAPQMAAYVLVCEAEGKPITRARYWSLEDAKTLDVLGPGGRDREEYGPALTVFEGYLKWTADRLRGGDFRPPRPEDRDCGNCGWQAVCRARYATE